MKIAVIGLGRIGKVHLRNLVKRVPVSSVQVVSGSAEGKEFAWGLGVTNCFKTIAELLASVRVEAAILCTPSAVHPEQVITFLKAGAAVFCEKPLAIELEKIQSIHEVETQTGKPVMVGFNRRFDPQFSAIRKGIQEGKTGILKIIKITSRDPAPPPPEYIRQSGGLFLDMAIHDFDMARFMAGVEVIRVHATGHAFDPVIAETGDIDTAVTTLEFENGLTSVIDNSRSTSYGYDQRLEVLGSRGMALIDNVTEDRAHWFDASGGHSARPLHFFLERYADAFEQEMDAFLAMITTGRPPLVGSYDAMQATAIALAAGRSLGEKRPVDVAEFNFLSATHNR